MQQPREAMMASARNMWRSGDRISAERLLREVMANHPKDRESPFALSQLLREMGRSGEAATLLEDVIEKRGHHPRLQEELDAARNETRAAKAQRQGARQNPAAMARAGGPVSPGGGIPGVTPFPGSAGPRAGAGVGPGPGSPPAGGAGGIPPASEVLKLGRERVLKGDYATAVQMFGKAVQVYPDDIDIVAGLGAAYQGLGMAPQAIHAYEKVVQHRPDHVPVITNLGHMYRLQGEFARALETYERALRIDPKYGRALAGQAETFEMMGRRDEAWSAIRSAAATSPMDASVLSTYGTIATRLNRAGEAIDAMVRASEQPDLLRSERMKLFFALGRAHEELERYDEAFAAFSKGNALVDRSWFTIEQYRQVIDSYIDTFSAERMPALPRAAEASDVPVFILGMPRSGTSLVEQIVSCHPDSFGAGELRDIPELSQRLQHRLRSRLPYPACAAEMTQQVADEASKIYLSRLRSTPGWGKRRISDKLPHNFLHIGLICMIAPGSRIVHCRRSPLDTCASCFTTNLNNLHAYSVDLTLLGQAYREYHRLMAHWESVASVSMTEVVYESLVRDPEHETRRLIDACGLEWNEACLKPHESKRTTLTASVDQVRRPINTKSIGRWRCYEKHLGPLIDALGDLADA